MSQDSDLKGFFEDGFYEEYWAPELSEEDAAKEARQVLRLLGAKRGHLLDWRGGWGRHAIHFAEAGLSVTLLDFIPHFLECARRQFEEKGLAVRTVLADCRDTPASIQADFATCLMNSIGFLEPAEELRAFESLREALRPGGRVILDCTNLFFLARDFRPSFERTGEDGTVYRSYGDLDVRTNILRKTFEIVRPDGQVARKRFDQTMYTPRDLTQLVTDAGFRVDELYGNFEGDPVAFHTPKTILVAQR